MQQFFVNVGMLLLTISVVSLNLQQLIPANKPYGVGLMLLLNQYLRSEERRVGKECGS